jgi:hypothetical protein
MSSNRGTTVYYGKQIPVPQTDWRRGARYERIRLKFNGKCCVCRKAVAAGEELMWDTRFPGNVFCEECAEECRIATPRERGLFDL